ncbi:ttr-46, partial [Pristionchus pacificus]
FRMKFALVFALFGCALAMRDQSIAVTGKLVCGQNPAKEVRVKLWEEDSGPDPDDLLDQGYTDTEGKFLLSGGTTELTPIDPIFKVYHDCDDGVLPGARKVKFGIPKSYITEGKVPKKTFDIGIINLETIFKNEEREMIVSKRSIRARRGGINEEMDDTAILEQEQKEAEEKRKISVSKKDSSESDSDERFF